MINLNRYLVCRTRKRGHNRSLSTQLMIAPRSQGDVKMKDPLVYNLHFKISLIIILCTIFLFWLLLLLLKLLLLFLLFPLLLLLLQLFVFCRCCVVTPVVVVTPRELGILGKYPFEALWHRFWYIKIALATSWYIIIYLTDYNDMVYYNVDRHRPMRKSQACNGDICEMLQNQ